MSVGRGWAGIEAVLHAELAAIGVHEVSTYQKYGWLHCDVSPWSPEAQLICDRVKTRSETTCEICGAQPAERHRRGDGWIVTMCARHATGPIVRYRPGWQARVDRLVDELAAIDPTAEVIMVDPTLLGPKGHWEGASEAGRALIMAALEELAHICGRCGRVRGGADRLLRRMQEEVGTMTMVVHRVEVSARGMKELRPEMYRLTAAGWRHVDCVKPSSERLVVTACVVAAFVKELR